MGQQEMATQPTHVSESVDPGKTVPLWIRKVVYVQGHVHHIVGEPTTYNQYHVLRADHLVLVPCLRLNITSLWSLKPIPNTVVMPSESPQVIKSLLFSISPSEEQYHVSFVLTLPYTSSVISPWLWNLHCFRVKLNLPPKERAFLNAQIPNLA